MAILDKLLFFFIFCDDNLRFMYFTLFCILVVLSFAGLILVLIFLKNYFFVINLLYYIIYYIFFFIYISILLIFLEHNFLRYFLKIFKIRLKLNNLIEFLYLLHLLPYLKFYIYTLKIKLSLSFFIISDYIVYYFFKKLFLISFFNSFFIIVWILFDHIISFLKSLISLLLFNHLIISIMMYLKFIFIRIGGILNTEITTSLTPDVYDISEFKVFAFTFFDSIYSFISSLNIFFFKFKNYLKFMLNLFKTNSLFYLYFVFFERIFFKYFHGSLNLLLLKLSLFFNLKFKSFNLKGLQFLNLNVLLIPFSYIYIKCMKFFSIFFHLLCFFYLNLLIYFIYFIKILSILIFRFFVVFIIFILFLKFFHYFFSLFFFYPLDPFTICFIWVTHIFDVLHTFFYDFTEYY